MSDTIQRLKAVLDEVPAKVEQSVSPRDVMYESGTQQNYFNFGLGALRCIKIALATAGKEQVGRILDLPCGHGRVLRVLRAAFPAAEITACDLDRDAVDFCAATFNAIPVYSTEEPADIPLHGSFDLIWCGSLLTHFDQDRWEGFLRRFNSLLGRNGVLVFTASGRWIARHTKDGTRKFGGLSHSAVEAMLEAYARTGFGYADYGHQKRHGISLSSPAWVCSLLERATSFRLLCFTERGWFNQQDTIACIQEKAPLKVRRTGD
jgi:SAM-dependent methyltransferase